MGGDNTMTVHLVTFSDESMSRSAELCIESGYAHGTNGHARNSPGNIMHNDAMRPYWPEMDRMFSHARGCGYWSWKPLIIKTDMELLSDGDILIYSDAGVEFINNVSHIIERMDQDIFLFGNNWEHAHWCKRDVLAAVMPQATQCPACHKWCGGAANRIPCEAGYYYHPTIGKQVQASVIFFRVSDYTRQLVKEWLDWCLSGARIGAALTFGKDNPEHRDERATWSEFRPLIDDSPSVLPNHPEFREHRHDQAILTTMAYREGIKLHYWPAVYNKGGTPEFLYEQLKEYAGDDYPILFSHHRRRNHEWSDAA